MVLTNLQKAISYQLIMQLFSIPIEAGKYNIAVRYWLERSIKGDSVLVLFTTVVTHIFSSFLLFGTVPVKVSLLGDVLKRSVSQYERFISSAISRGYALVVLWSPGAINLLLVVQATGVGWTKLLIPGLLLSLIGIITSIVLESKLRLSDGLKPGREAGGVFVLSETAARRKAYQIIIVVVSLVLLTVLLEKLKFGSYSNRILFAGAIIVLIWTSFFMKQPGFKAVLKNYWRNALFKTVDLEPLFLSLGIFPTAVEKAGVIAVIQPDLQFIANALGLFSMAALPLLMIVCAVGGIHPFVSIVMIGTILT